MNIAIFTDVFLPLTNGVVSVIINSSKELIKRGHKIKIFAPKIGSIEKYKDDLKNIEFCFYKATNTIFHDDIKLGFTFLPKTLKELHAFHPDIIHFHTPFMVGIEGALAAKILDIPLIGTFHTFLMDPEFLSNVPITKFAMGPIEKLVWKYSNFIHGQADILIAPSKYTKNTLKESKIKTKVIQINNGIPLKSHKQKIKPNHNCVYIGRLSPEKNIDILLKSFAIVIKAIPDSHLKIVGGGRMQKKLELLAQELNITKNVTFTGQIPNQEILKGKIYENQSVFINTSTSENQPMAIIEAMSFGMPIIGVKSKGMPELVTGNGLLCENAAPETIAKNIIDLLLSPDLISKFSTAAKQKSRNYDISKTTTDLENLYITLKKWKRFHFNR